MSLPLRDANAGKVRGGGGVLSPKLDVDVPAGPRKSDYLYTNFLPNFPPISIPFLKEKHPIWIKLGAFYNNLPKIHPIYVIWAPSSLMKTPRSLYQISRKSAPKGRHIYVYHVNVRTPPPGVKSQGKSCTPKLFLNNIQTHNSITVFSDLSSWCSVI